MLQGKLPTMTMYPALLRMAMENLQHVGRRRTQVLLHCKAKLIDLQHAAHLARREMGSFVLSEGHAWLANPIPLVHSSFTIVDRA